MPPFSAHSPPHCWSTPSHGKNGITPAPPCPDRDGDVTAAMSALSYLMLLSAPIISGESVTDLHDRQHLRSLLAKSGLPASHHGSCLLIPDHLLGRAPHHRAVLGRRHRPQCGQQRTTPALLYSSSLSVALSGAAVAFGGAINFIGLMAPHISLAKPQDPASAR